MTWRPSLASSALWLAALSTAGAARAEPSPSAPVAQTEGWTLRVDSDAPDLEADRVRAAVAGELHRTGSWGSGELHVRVDADGTAVLTCNAAGHPPRVRRVTLDRSPEAALETLVLLSASLVRTDADTLATVLAGNGQASAQRDRAFEAQEVAPEATPKPPAAHASGSPPAAKQPEHVPAVPSTDSPSPTRRPSELPLAPANLSLWHPLAILPNSNELRLRAELGLFYGHVGAVEGAALNGLVLRIRQDLRGAAVSGVWLDTGGSVEGVSLSGLAQRGEGPVWGAAVAGAVDLRGASVEGLQVAGLLTSAHEAKGTQLAGVLSLAHDMDGAQIAGVTVLADDVEGAQVAGVTALADDVEGAQVAGAFTHNARLRGAQVGAVNVSADVEGVQIGVVNVGGRVRGTQIGVVNVADDLDGFPIGLVNWVGSGRNQAVAWYGGPRAPYNVALKYLHGAVYTMLAVGAKPEGDRTTWGPGAGLGGRIDLIGPAFAEVDALWQHEAVTEHDPVRQIDGFHVVRGRAALGAQALPWLALFAGGGPLLEIQDETGDVGWKHHFFGGVQVF